MIICDEAIEYTSGFTMFARVVQTRRDGAWRARLTGSQSPGVLKSMATANALAVIPEATKTLAVEDAVECMLLS